MVGFYLLLDRKLNASEAFHFAVIHLSHQLSQIECYEGVHTVGDEP